jgi:hypothetical protein
VAKMTKTRMKKAKNRSKMINILSLKVAAWAMAVAAKKMCLMKFNMKSRLKD